MLGKPHVQKDFFIHSHANKINNAVMIPAQLEPNHLNPEAAIQKVR